MSRRYLVICPVGVHDSAHKQWLDPARNFDLFLVNYSDTPGLYRDDADRYFEIPGFKLQIVSQALRESREQVQQYSALWLPDDDLGISTTQVNRLFRLFEEHDLDLGQPAVANEHFNHTVTRRQPGCRLRFVNFVEMMCPLFRTEVLLDQLHLFDLTQSGMGINYLWSQNTLKRITPGDPRYHKNVAIIDEVSVVHRKPQSRSGPYYQKLAAMGVEPTREAEQLLADHNLSHVMWKYETYSTMYSRPLGAPVAALHKAKKRLLHEFRSRASVLKNSLRRRIAPSASPVILCGMHGSGTTLLAKMLKQLGVFLGEDLQQNLESKSFQELNTWLMDLGRAHGKCPRPVWNPDEKETISQELQRRHNKCFVSFLDRRRQFLSLRGIPFRWGWNDPLNTITLPLWLRLYPEAKVIFLVRNGVDVAHTLVEQESDSQRSGASNQENAHPGHSEHRRDFDENFAMWEHYAEIFETQSVAAIPKSAQLFRLRFEDLLEQPTQTIARLALFVDLPAASPEALPELIESLRAYGNQRSTTGEHLEQNRTSAWMEHYGYVQKHESLLKDVH